MHDVYPEFVIREAPEVVLDTFLSCRQGDETLAEAVWRDGHGMDPFRQAVDALFIADPKRLSDEEVLARIDEAMAVCHEGLRRHAFMHASMLAQPCICSP